MKDVEEGEEDSMTTDPLFQVLTLLEEMAIEIGIVTVALLLSCHHQDTMDPLLPVSTVLLLLVLVLTVHRLLLPIITTVRLLLVNTATTLLLQDQCHLPLKVKVMEDLLIRINSVTIIAHLFPQVLLNTILINNKVLRLLKYNNNKHNRTQVTVSNKRRRCKNF